jgi:hypothetical protein
MLEKYIGSGDVDIVGGRWGYCGWWGAMEWRCDQGGRRREWSGRWWWVWGGVGTARMTVQLGGLRRGWGRHKRWWVRLRWHLPDENNGATGKMRSSKRQWGGIDDDEMMVARAWQETTTRSWGWGWRGNGAVEVDDGEVGEAQMMAGEVVVVPVQREEWQNGWGQRDPRHDKR